MEGKVVLADENIGVGAKKVKGEKMGNKTSAGGAPRKKLADISNLMPRPDQTNQMVKEQSLPLKTVQYIEQLQKDNMILLKLLAERNRLIELRQIDINKLQEQNLHLAQANSQMQGELNSAKDQLRILRHELACKNGLLKARNIELKDNAKTVECQITGNEAGIIMCNEAEVSSQADEPCTNKMRHSKKSWAPSNATSEQASEKAENKRVRVKSQSTKFKRGEPEPSEDLMDKDDTKFPLYEQASGKVENKSVRRQSARLKREEPGPSQDLFEVDTKKFPASQFNDSVDGSGTSTFEVLDKKDEVKIGKADNKRVCVRRQSARFKCEKTEHSEDLFEVDDTNFPVSMYDGSGTSTSGVSIKKEDGENVTPGVGVEDFRRSSFSRPVRRAAEKVQSYKEISIKVKMRRSE